MTFQPPLCNFMSNNFNYFSNFNEPKEIYISEVYVNLYLCEYEASSLSNHDSLNYLCNFNEK